MNHRSSTSPGLGMPSPRDPRPQSRSYAAHASSQPAHHVQLQASNQSIRQESQEHQMFLQNIDDTFISQNQNYNGDSGDDVVICGIVPPNANIRRETSQKKPQTNGDPVSSYPEANRPGIKKKTRPKKNQSPESKNNPTQAISSSSLPEKDLETNNSVPSIVTTTDAKVTQSVKPAISSASKVQSSQDRPDAMSLKTVLISPVPCSNSTSHTNTNPTLSASTSSHPALLPATSTTKIACTITPAQPAASTIAQQQATSEPLQKISIPSKNAVPFTVANNVALIITSDAIKQVKFDDSKHELEFNKAHPATSISQSQQLLPTKSSQASQNISSILKTPTSSISHISSNILNGTSHPTGQHSRKLRVDSSVGAVKSKPDPNQVNKNIDAEMADDGQHLSSKSRAAYPAYGFDWDLYLEIAPAEVAPREAFRQTTKHIANLFQPNMKLEARDPRNSASWALASVIHCVGLRIKLRFDGCDGMNDFYELVDSEAIRAVGSVPGEALLPPVGHKGAHHSYNRFVEKVLLKPNTKVAPTHYFITPPPKPDKNLFKTGMKLEAIDRKNPELICPATIGELNGEHVRVVFDGWKGSFDYTCKYDSRNLFPVNWCRDNNHPIATPAGWQGLLESKLVTKTSGKSDPSVVDCNIKNDRSKNLNPGSRTRQVLSDSKGQMSDKEIHLAKVHLQSRSSNASPKKSTSLQPDVNFSFKSDAPNKMNQSTPKKDNLKRPRSPSPDNAALLHEHDATITENDASDTLAEDDLPSHGSDIFQCQRTLTYSEHMKVIVERRHLEEQRKKIDQSNEPVLLDAQNQEKRPTHLTDMLKAIPKLTTESYSGFDNMIDSPTSANSFELNITDTSSVLTSPQIRSNICTNEQPRTVKNRRGRPPKKPRLDLQQDQDQGLSETQDQQSFIPLNYLEWQIEHVIRLIDTDASLAKYSEVFRSHEIDGKAFVLLTTDIMINHMGLKIGPVLKIMSLIDQVKLKKIDLRSL